MKLQRPRQFVDHEVPTKVPVWSPLANRCKAKTALGLTRMCVHASQILVIPRSMKDLAAEGSKDSSFDLAARSRRSASSSRLARGVGDTRQASLRTVYIRQPTGLKEPGIPAHLIPPSRASRQRGTVPRLASPKLGAVLEKQSVFLIGLRKPNPVTATQAVPPVPFLRRLPSMKSTMPPLRRISRHILPNLPTLLQRIASE